MKKDKIYENFKQFNNFDLAYKYIKSEFTDSSLALDPIWVSAVTSIDNYKDKFISTLIEILENYQQLRKKQEISHYHYQVFTEF